MSKSKSKISRFNESVLSKYEVYNSLFMTLPFEDIYQTGMLLPLLNTGCIKGYDENKNPTEILDSFFATYCADYTEKDKTNLLFGFIRYIERQVVLFDAIEDASFATVNNMEGTGTTKQIKGSAVNNNEFSKFKKLLGDCTVRTVLTAHPTQFYPDSVLGIINDLSAAISRNQIVEIKKLLAQLAKTPFFNETKPTPYDEAISLIWYLDNVFYKAIANIYGYIKSNVVKDNDFSHPVIQLGFWPAGDRDGNPMVTSDITLKVGDKLRSTIVRRYYKDIKKLKRKLTFRKASPIISDLLERLYKNIYIDFKKPNDTPITLIYIQQQLYAIREILIDEHQSLYLNELDDIINKTQLFGLHFATLDIRQDSRIHTATFEEVVAANSDIFPENYPLLSEQEKVEVLSSISTGTISSDQVQEELAKQTIESIYCMKTIQKHNGELGAHRYIISNTQSLLNIFEVFTMIKLCDWENPTVDIIPLFETINDLQNAADIMRNLYNNPVYKEHLERRGQQQTIMVGFSDGTKDGGYLMANWSIYKAKEELTAMSRECGISVTFFDGRGGPPARGGGKTHQFYASLGENIESKHVEITVQGQTISSNFGTVDACKYNLDQLLGATLVNQMNGHKNTLNAAQAATMQELADISYDSYLSFKEHPKFIPYLERMSTVKYYGKTNIGSRPAKRGKSDNLVFSDLRAIPFVGSWSQLKQNVPGFYGVGTSIKAFKDKGELDKVKDLYENSLFFRTLLENTMMSLTKSFFKLTAYMANDKEFGAFWQIIYDEYKLTKDILLELTGYSELMEETPSGKRSIQIRENIVLPLLTIQQYALRKLQTLEKTGGEGESEQRKIYEKMITRSLFGNINASRNSA